MQIPIESPESEWGVAIIAARETLPTLCATLQATMSAASPLTTIDVIVNGNPNLADETAHFCATDRWIAAAAGPFIRVWEIGVGDKANAWNQYIKHIWPRTQLTFFIDGYARPLPESFSKLAETMASDANLLAATGVPTIGRTAASLRREMLDNGGLHGNLFALRGSTIRDLLALKFRLPLGIYRVDSTLGAALSFGLDPGNNAWSPKRYIAVCPEASWLTDVKEVRKFSDVLDQAKRVLRQGRGILENLAVRNFLAIRKLSPGELPPTAQELIDSWIAQDRNTLIKAFLRNPVLVGAALRNLRQPRDWSDILPVLRYPTK